MNKKKINTAIVGFGLSGKVFHAPFLHIHPGFRLVTVVERHAENAKEFYPQVEIVRDLKEVLVNKGIELVVICTPNIYHFEMAKACLEAGKHIVIEKPFMPTSAEADEIIELAKKLGTTQSHVSKIERGELRLDILQLRIVCHTLDTPLTEFVDRLETRLTEEEKRRRGRSKRTKK